MSLGEGDRAAREWLVGGGELGALIRARDWSQTPLGPRERWPTSLRTAIGIVVECRLPMALLWGADSIMLHNDAFGVIAANEHPNVLGRPLREVWPEAWTIVAPSIEAVMTRGEPVHFEDEGPPLGGHGRQESTCLVQSVSPVRLEDGTVGGSLVAVQGMTATIERTRLLRESAVRFRTLFESIDEGFCIIEMLFDGEQPVDYRFLEINPVFEHQTGIERAVGRRMREIAPKHESHWFEIYGRVASTGEPLRFQREANALGRYYDVYAFRVGRPEQRQVGILFNDITERTRAERALREAEEKLRVAVANAAIGFAIGTPEGHLVDANPAFCRLIGYDIEELQDKRFLEFVHPEDLASNQAQLELMLRGETADFTIESRYTCKDGAPIWVRKSISLVRTAKGTPRWIIMLCEDITDRKLARELLHTNDLLEQSNREKAEFLALLSHELRNPLASITFGLDILDQSAPEGDHARRARETIGRQVKQLVRLVNDLLEMTRFSRGKLQLKCRRVELGELVQRTVEDHRSVYEKAGVVLDAMRSAGPVYVDADDDRIAQVVGNLLLNAVKFTPRAGCVTVSLVVEPTTMQAILRVADTGVGIDEAVLPRVFEPFVQAAGGVQRGKSGLGLGLALVKGVIELHGGSVEARSSGLGCGAEMIVRLPLATVPDPMSSRASLVL